jgi:hypothetical protein
MASITPRTWAASTRMTDDDENDSGDPEHQSLAPDCDPHDGRTPLDKTIDRIGMGRSSISCFGSVNMCRLVLLGSYQWTLVSLCGFGE